MKIRLKILKLKGVNKMNKIINFDSIAREEYDDKKIYLDRILGIDRTTIYKNENNNKVLCKNINVICNVEQTKESYYMNRTRYLYDNKNRIRLIKTFNLNNKWHHTIKYKYSNDNDYAIVIKNTFYKYKIEVLVKNNNIVFITNDIFDFKCVYDDENRIIKTIFKDKSKENVIPIVDNQINLLFDCCKYIGTSKIEYYDNGIKSIIKNNNKVILNNVLDDKGKLIKHTNLYLGDMDVTYNDNNEIIFENKDEDIIFIFDRKSKKIKYVKENMEMKFDEDYILHFNKKLLFMTKNDFKSIQVVDAYNTQVIGGYSNEGNSTTIASRNPEELEKIKMDLELIDYYLNIFSLDFFIGIDNFKQRLEKSLKIYVI